MGHHIDVNDYIYQGSFAATMSTGPLQAVLRSGQYRALNLANALITTASSSYLHDMKR